MLRRLEILNKYNMVFVKDHFARTSHFSRGQLPRIDIRIKQPNQCSLLSQSGVHQLYGV